MTSLGRVTVVATSYLGSEWLGLDTQEREMRAHRIIMRDFLLVAVEKLLRNEDCSGSVIKGQD